MKFTYKAPVEYNDLASGFRTVESEYHGPHDFKVLVDALTHQIASVEFDHDGDLAVHNGTDASEGNDECYMIYLHSHNPNHIVLMALLTNHEGHVANNKIEIVCEKYNMVYQRHEPPAVDHVYNLKKITINRAGVVTYPWWKMDSTWENLVAQGKSHRNTIKERLRVDILTQNQVDKANYCVEIIDYVILNEVSKTHPWKVAWPDIHSVSLDNSIRIGIPEEGENGPREMPNTPEWGIVPHGDCCHMDGDDVVIAAICPTTDAEALTVAPWIDLCEDHPTHCTAVNLWSVVTELILANDPDISLTKEIILEAFHAYPDINTTTENTSLSVDAAHGVLSNDTDDDINNTHSVSAVDGEPANVNSVTKGSTGGTFVIRSDGSYRFTPGKSFLYLNNGETAATEISYTNLSSNGSTATSVLTIVVTGVDGEIPDMEEAAPQI